MRIALTGHTEGLGKAICERWPGEVMGFSRTNGYDITDAECRRRIVHESMNAEVFINCAHDGMAQVYLLYELCDAWKRTDRLIINISSNSSDGIKSFRHVYAVEKSALDKASEQLSLLPDSCRITNIKPGYIDVPRVGHIANEAKIPIDRMVDEIAGVIEQSHHANIHSMTILPRRQHHDWYYTDLSFPWFDDARCDRIREIASRVIDESRHEGYEYSYFDHLRFYDLSRDMPEIGELVDDCEVSARADIFYLPPNVEMPIHSDTMDYGSIRGSTIAVALLPEIGIPDTHWYWSTRSPPCATARWSANQAKLLNIRSLHGGIKTDDRWRANLQLSLPIGYDEALARIREGRLFRNHEVRIDVGR